MAAQKALLAADYTPTYRETTYTIRCRSQVGARTGREVRVVGKTGKEALLTSEELQVDVQSQENIWNR